MDKIVTVRFFKSSRGNEPVREWLKALSITDKKSIGEVIKTVEFSWPLGLPLVRHLSHDLWEIRLSLSGRRIVRILFCMHRQKMVLLHGFIKKSQKTPKDAIVLARTRIKQLKGEK